MKKITAILFLAALLVLNTIPGSSQDTTIKKATLESLKKKSDSVKFYADSLKKVAKNNGSESSEPKKDINQSPDITNLVIIVLFFAVMILLFVRFFKHLKDHNQRIGFQSIKLIGLILIFPGICILALVGGEKVLSGNTLAVLLGTIAGYVLSRDDDKEPPNDAARRKQEELQAKIKELEDHIKLIKEKNPNLTI